MLWQKLFLFPMIPSSRYRTTNPSSPSTHLLAYSSLYLSFSLLLLCIMPSVLSGVDVKAVGMAAVAIAGLPAAWNVVARNEYHHHTLERLLRGKKRGAYFLAAAIFLASFVRDAAFQRAMDANPPAQAIPLLPASLTAGSADKLRAAMGGLKAVGAALFAAGTTLVVSSFLRLGVTGTYLGDYFGIKMSERVTAFPFSHFENPMYLGATLNFLGAAVAQNNGVGVLLTGWVALVYHVSTTYFENPFTAMIYQEDSTSASTQAAKKA